MKIKGKDSHFSHKEFANLAEKRRTERFNKESLFRRERRTHKLRNLNKPSKRMTQQLEESAIRLAREIQGDNAIQS